MPEIYRNPYNKPVRTPAELVAHLRAKGLVVEDEESAAAVLARVSYYRFKGYALPFRDGRNPGKLFREGVTFDDILSVMEFDASLRAVTMNAIAPVELAFRTAMNEVMCVEDGSPFWYAEKAYFDRGFDHPAFCQKAIREFDRSRELFVTHFKKTYDYPPHPPGWMLIETTSFGTWSILYKNITDSSVKQKVADCFGGYHFSVLENWIHCLCIVRNHCAHHARLWNRIFGVTPRFPNKEPRPAFLTDKKRFGAMAYIIQNLSKIIATNAPWAEALKRLLDGQDAERLYSMGFAEGWDQDKFWS